MEGVLTILTPQALYHRVANASWRSSAAPTNRCSPVGWVRNRCAKGAQALRGRRHPHLPHAGAAVELFGHISAYHRNQKLLVQTPSSLSST